MSRKATGSGNETFRVHIDHVLADGSATYLTQTFGPYSTLSAAKSTRTRELAIATSGRRKAKARIERADLHWIEVHR